MPTIATCGHRLDSSRDGIELTLAGHDCDPVEGYARCVGHVTLCQRCADNARGAGIVLDTEADEVRWLNGGDEC
jgi:hypothetical protein